MTTATSRHPAPTARTRSARGGTGTRWLLVPPLALLVLGLLGPLIAVLASGASDHGVTGLVTEPFKNELFVKAAWRTLQLTVLVTVLTWVIGTVFALAVGLAPSWLGKVLMGVLFLTFWISLLVRTYGWVLTLQPKGALDNFAESLGLTGDKGLGLYQTTPGLVPAMVHIMLPYMVLPVYASLRSIEPSQLKAARSLGAGDWLTLRKVVLPALRSGTVAGLVLVFVMSLGFYVTPAFLGGPGNQVVAIVIGTEFGRLTDLGGAAAMGFVLLVVVLGLYLLADRFFRISEQWERF